MPDILTMGTFDVLHPGHLGLLRLCRSMAKGGRVTVAVNTDEFVARFKGVTPIFTVEERVSMLRGCRWVDEVVQNDGDHQPDIVSGFTRRDGIVVVGDDWKGRDYLAQIGLADQPRFFELNLLDLVYVPRSGAWSTTGIRQRVLDRG